MARKPDTITVTHRNFRDDAAFEVLYRLALGVDRDEARRNFRFHQRSKCRPRAETTEPDRQ
ncbi:MAG: hypothetical protein IT494_04520 [Gammaproteobacteria bacterium]|nr:hypothetical protein [Gammaproteobacteria bacterium]